MVLALVLLVLAVAAWLAVAWVLLVRGGRKPAAVVVAAVAAAVVAISVSQFAYDVDSGVQPDPPASVGGPEPDRAVLDSLRRTSVALQAELARAEEELAALKRPTRPPSGADIAVMERRVDDLRRSRAGLRGLEALAGEEARSDPAEACRTCGYAGWAEVRYAHPEVMRYREPSQVGLALVPGAAAVAADEVLDPERYGGRVREAEAPVRFALAMRAMVSAPEADFRIEPAEWEVRNVRDLGEPMTWSWYVTPLRPGPDRTLTYRFQAVLMEDGAERPFGSREEVVTVSVDVTPWGRLTLMAGEVTAVHAAIAGVGGTGVAVVAWLLGWFRRPKPKDPTRVEVSFTDERDRPD